MPEAVIKRVNFFDGQFLKQGEFLDLDAYHRHMRRRVLHLLFASSGVIPLEPDDLMIEIENLAQKLIRVRAGTAVGKRDDIVEAKEIVLREDQVIDLNLQSPPLQSGDTALVTIHYAELLTEPSSEGGVTGDTRVEEQAVLTVHRNTLPGAAASNGEPFVQLGHVDFDTLAIDLTQRREVTIRSSLIGTASPTPGPTVTGISPASGTPGSTVNAQITGTDLAGATAVTFSGSGITATIQTSSATTVDVELDIASGAPVGAQSFIVATPQGSANSGGVTFNVTPVPVNVTSIAPTIVSIQASAPPGSLTVRGTNIRASGLNPGEAATGTVVRFVDAGNLAIVLATASNPIVLPNIASTQQIQVDLPLAGDFSAQQSPVRVEVLFGGGSGIAPQNLNLSFP